MVIAFCCENCNGTLSPSHGRVPVCFRFDAPSSCQRLQHVGQESATHTEIFCKVSLDGLMIPFRTLLLHRLMRSAWTVGAIALVTASLLEWGLIVADPARLS